MSKETYSIKKYDSVLYAEIENSTTGEILYSKIPQWFVYWWDEKHHHLNQDEHVCVKSAWLSFRKGVQAANKDEVKKLSSKIEELKREVKSYKKAIKQEYIKREALDEEVRLQRLKIKELRTADKKVNPYGFGALARTVEIVFNENNQILYSGLAPENEPRPLGEKLVNSGREYLIVESHTLAGVLGGTLIEYVVKEAEPALKG